MAKYCKDCKNCATFDVFKGNCEALGKRVIIGIFYVLCR